MLDGAARAGPSRLANRFHLLTAGLCRPTLRGGGLGEGVEKGHGVGRCGQTVCEGLAHPPGVLLPLVVRYIT